MGCANSLCRDARRDGKETLALQTTMGTWEFISILVINKGEMVTVEYLSEIRNGQEECRYVDGLNEWPRGRRTEGV